MGAVVALFLTVVVFGFIVGAFILAAVLSSFKPSHWPWASNIILLAAAVIFFVLALPHYNAGIFGRHAFDFMIYGSLAGLLALVGVAVRIMWFRKTAADDPAESKKAPLSDTNDML